MLFGSSRPWPAWIYLIAAFVSLAALDCRFSGYSAVSCPCYMLSTARRVQTEWHAFPVVSPSTGLEYVYKSVRLSYMDGVSCASPGTKHKFRYTKFEAGPSKRAFNYHLRGSESLIGYCLFEKKHVECAHCRVSVKFKLVRARREGEVLNATGVGTHSSGLGGLWSLSSNTRGVCICCCLRRLY